MPEYDVSVHQVSKGVACFMCSFGDTMDPAYTAESTKEMIDHLNAHEKVGDRIPVTIKDDLWRDDFTNFPRPDLPPPPRFV